MSPTPILDREQPVRTKKPRAWVKFAIGVVIGAGPMCFSSCVE